MSMVFFLRNIYFTMYMKFLELAYNPQSTCQANHPHFNKYIC